MAHGGRREEVLRVARDAFHERGYERTATRDIAARLGILGGSLYYYIDSKEALLCELLTAVQAPGRAALDRALADSDAPAAARLDSLIREHVAVTVADPTGIALVFSELGSLTPAHRGQVLEGLRAYRRGLQAVLAAGRREGAVRAGLEIKPAALGVLGALNWVHRWYRPDGRLPPAELAEQLSRLVLHGLAAPGAREGAPPPPPPPSRAVVDDVPKRRRQLLDVAAELFSERGYEATTAADVAARLGLGKSSLYHHVRGKGELLYALMREVQEPSLAMLASTRESDADPLAKVRAVVERHVGFVVRHRLRTGLFLEERRSLPPERRAAVGAGERKYVAGVVELIDEGRRAGVVRADLDPAVAARGLLGAVNWVHRWYRPDGSWTPERVGDALAGVLLAGVLARPPSGSIFPIKR